VIALGLLLVSLALVILVLLVEEKIDGIIRLGIFSLVGIGVPFMALAGGQAKTDYRQKNEMSSHRGNWIGEQSPKGNPCFTQVK
jgi:hypothetical protein